MNLLVMRRFLLTYRETNVENCKPGNTNIAVAGLVTAYGRLELYSYLEKIESARPGSVLYFDTDSVIFCQDKGQELIPLGSCLGEMTDELSKFGMGSVCKRAVFLGPKNYGYEVECGDGRVEREIKCKGITLTEEVRRIINIEEMICMAKKYIYGENRELSVPQFRIASKKYTQDVFNLEFDKVYRAVSKKRMVRGNKTLPFGWRE